MHTITYRSYHCARTVFRLVSEKNEHGVLETNEENAPQAMEDVLDNKSGLLIVPTNSDIQFTVSRFTDSQIFAARHPNELTPSSNIYVRLDAAQRGLGTGSCGPQTLTEYQVDGGTYQVSFLVRHVRHGD